MTEVLCFSDGRPIPDYPGFDTEVHLSDLEETVGMVTNMAPLKGDDARFIAGVLLEELGKMNSGMRDTP